LKARKADITERRNQDTAQENREVPSNKVLSEGERKNRGAEPSFEGMGIKPGRHTKTHRKFLIGIERGRGARRLEAMTHLKNREIFVGLI